LCSEDLGLKLPTFPLAKSVLMPLFAAFPNPTSKAAKTLPSVLQTLADIFN
jgi:hypothetical protein